MSSTLKSYLFNTPRTDDGFPPSTFTGLYWNKVLTFLKNEADELNHYFVRTSDPDANTIMDFIQSNSDLSLTNSDWANFINDNNFWNESIKSAWKHYQNYDNQNDTILSPWTFDDIKKADAGYEYDSTKKFVKPWKNIDESNYKSVRGTDMVTSVINSSRHSQFTHTQLRDWIRLIMPTNPRRVEIEDLNRNFWVIGQTLSIISKFLFDNNSPIRTMFHDLFREITEQWENMLYLWTDYALLCGKNNSINLIQDLPKDRLHPYRQFDNFGIGDITTDILNTRFAYLPQKYGKSQISLLVRVRQNNYFYNYYSKETYPYYGYYDGEEWTWFPIETFSINVSDFNGKYGMKIDDNVISYGPYNNTNYSIAALRIKPSITQGGLNPTLQFTIHDAVGEAVEDAVSTQIYAGTILDGNSFISVFVVPDPFPTAIKTGTTTIDKIKKPFCGSEVATIGIKQVME